MVRDRLQPAVFGSFYGSGWFIISISWACKNASAVAKQGGEQGKPFTPKVGCSVTLPRRTQSHSFDLAENQTTLFEHDGFLVGISSTGSSLHYQFGGMAESEGIFVSKYGAFYDSRNAQESTYCVSSFLIPIIVGGAQIIGEIGRNRDSIMDWLIQCMGSLAEKAANEQWGNIATLQTYWFLYCLLDIISGPVGEEVEYIATHQGKPRLNFVIFVFQYSEDFYNKYLSGIGHSCSEYNSASMSAAEYRAEQLRGMYKDYYVNVIICTIGLKGCDIESPEEINKFLSGRFSSGDQANLDGVDFVAHGQTNWMGDSEDRTSSSSIAYEKEDGSIGTFTGKDAASQIVEFARDSENPSGAFTSTVMACNSGTEDGLDSNFCKDFVNALGEMNSTLNVEITGVEGKGEVTSSGVQAEKTNVYSGYRGACDGKGGFLPSKKSRKKGSHKNWSK